MNPHPRNNRVNGQKSYQSRHSNKVGTLVDVPTNELGYLDDEILHDLRCRLYRLLTPPHSGDIVLDITQVRSLSLSFSVMLEEFLQLLSPQQRHLRIFDERTGLIEAGCWFERAS